MLLRDPVLALDFDLAAAARLIAAEREAAQELGREGGLAQTGEDDVAAPRTCEVRW